MSDLRTDLARGPWHAVALDGSGYVLEPEDMADCVSIAVVRGAAIPRPTEDDDPQMPAGGWQLGDVLYRLDNLDDEPERTPVLWDQARAVVAALNTHRPDWPTGSDDDTAWVRLEARGDAAGVDRLTELLFTLDPAATLTAGRRRPDNVVLVRAELDMPTDMYAAVGRLLAPLPQDMAAYLADTRAAATGIPKATRDGMRAAVARLVGDPS